MRILLLTGMLMLQFFFAPRSEAKAPARCSGTTLKREERWSKATTLPVAEYLNYSTRVSQVTQLRRHLPTGGLMVSPLFLSRTPMVVPSTLVQSKESFCIPIARRLLFPRHYFW